MALTPRANGADITAIATAEGWLSLAVVLDLFSRIVVGWAMAPVENEQLVTLALQMALARRHPQAGLLHHSDRGSEYTSQGYQARLAEQGIARQYESDGQLLRQCSHGVLL